MDHKSVNFSAPAVQKSPSFGERGQQPIKGILKKRHFFNLGGDSSKYQHKTDVFEDDVKDPSIKSEYSDQFSQRFHDNPFNPIITFAGIPQLNILDKSQSVNKSLDNIPSQEKFALDYQQFSEDKIPSSDIKLSPEVDYILDESEQLKPSGILKEGNLQDVWKRKSFQIIYHITKFSKQLKTYASKFKFRQLTYKIIDLIGDNAADEDEIIHLKQLYNREVENVSEDRDTLILSIKHNLYRTQKLIAKSIPIIQPDGPFRVIWNAILLVLITANIFYIPMKLSFSFNGDQSSIPIVLLQTIPTWIFVIDILLNFNTAYYNKGMIHTKRKEIINNYLKGNFRLDLVIIIPLIMSFCQVPYSDFLLILRGIRLKSIVDHLEEVLNLNFEIQAVCDLIKSVFFIIFVSHMVACAWHYIGEIQIVIYGSTDSWLLSYQVYNDPWWSKYIYSLYFSTITTLTIGYGDIAPKSSAERVFVIIVALIACGVFGYTISSIGEIFRNVMERQQHYKSQMKFINQYLKSKTLRKELQLKIRKYFEYYFKMESTRNAEGERLIGLLTKKLKEELHFDLYYNLLGKSRILKQNLSDKSLRELSQCVRELTFAPEEEIFAQGDQATRLLFVIDGEVLVIAQQQIHDYSSLAKETILKKVDSGNCIGEPEFATTGFYKYSLRADKFTTIAYINYDDFYKLVKENENTLHQYCQMKDNLQYNPNFSNFGQICEVCRWTHHFTKCPFVFHQPNRGRIAKIFNMDVSQPRKSALDRSMRRAKSFKQLEQTQECALAYIINNNIMGQMDLTDNYLSSLGFKMENESINQETEGQSPIIQNVLHRVPSTVNTSIVMGEADIQAFKYNERSFFNFDKSEKSHHKIDLESQISNSYSNIGTKPKHTQELPSRSRSRYNTNPHRKDQSFIGSIGKQLSIVSKESSSLVPRRAVQFTVQPIISEQTNQLSKQVALSRDNKHDVNIQKQASSMDMVNLQGLHHYSTRDLHLAQSSMVHTHKNIMRISRASKPGSHRLSVLINDFENSLLMTLERNNSQQTFNKNLSNIDQEIVNDVNHYGEMDTRMMSTLHERIDYDIDKWLPNSEIYFPNFDVNFVIKILQTIQDKKIQQMNKKRKKSMIPYLKFKSMTNRAPTTINR